MDRPFEPKLITVLREGYSLKSLRQDVLAGIIVGIVALPLSIAIAIASGVKPEQGLITAIIGGFIIAALSGSRVQIGGPTGAFIIIVYGIAAKYGYEGLATATLMAGVLLVIMGIARLGDVIKFIPYPVTVGFTSGIALIIFSSQIPDFLGLPVQAIPEHFLNKWAFYANHFFQNNLIAIFLGGLTIFIVVFWRYVTDKIPGPLIAIIATTLLVQYFHLPVDTIGSRFGSVPNTIPAPHLPNIKLDFLIQMSSPALTIAILAGIESLLSAVVADGMTGRRHRSNMELIAQGAANIVSPLFGGIPATGAIARTATNIKNGGQTPIAGLVHAITVLLIFIFFGKLAALIPMASLAGILIVVAYNMSEWHLFIKISRGSKSDTLVLLITFLLTLLVNLTIAIEVGMVLAAFLFMKRMIDTTQVNILSGSLSSDEEEMADPEHPRRNQIPPGVEIFEINGPFFFGAADKFKDTLLQLKRPPKVLILGMRHVPVIDTTALQALEDLLTTSKKNRIAIVFCAVQPSPFKTLNKAGIPNMVGEDNFLPNFESAILRAQEIMDGKNSSK